MFGINKLSLLLVFICVGIIAGCGAASASTSPTPTPTPSPSPSPAPTATATPIPKPSAETLGTPVQTTAGASYEVIAYQASVSSNNEFNTPPPSGGFFSAANVKECAGNTGTVLFASPAEWSLTMTDDSQVEGGDASLNNVPGTPLQTESLSDAHCVSGWIVFTVAGGEVPAQIAPINSDFYWAP